MVKIDTDTAAKLMFVTVLLISAAVAAIWYWHSVSRYAIYQIDTTDPVSGLVIDAPVEFHGVDVGKYVEDRLRRGVDDDLARRSNCHVGKSNPRAAGALVNARVTSGYRPAVWWPSAVTRPVPRVCGKTAAQAPPARRRRCRSRSHGP